MDDERELREQDEEDDRRALERAAKEAANEDDLMDAQRTAGRATLYPPLASTFTEYDRETLRLARRRRDAEDALAHGRGGAAELEQARADERAHRTQGDDAVNAPKQPQEPECGPGTPTATEEAATPRFSGNRSYSVKEAAEAAACDVETVRRHIAAGRLKAHKRGEVGPWRIWGSDLEEWA
jgi:excisionase family DNA binding protein